MKGKWMILASIVLLAGFMINPAQAKYPDRTITVIVPFSAGGTTGLQTQIIKPFLEKHLGVSVVPSFKPGAGGEVGWTELAKSRADGYTIGNINLPHIVLQPIARPTGYKTNDFIPIISVVEDPACLVVRNDSKFGNLKEFIDYAKKNPGVITVGIVGTFTGDHLSFLMLEDVAGIKIKDVPFKGGAPQFAAVMGGHVDAVMGNIGDVVPRKEKLKILGVGSKARNPDFPNSLTFKEQGLDIISAIVRGWGAPAKTPKQDIEVLKSAFEKVVADPAWMEAMKKGGLPIRIMKQKEFQKFIEEQKSRSLKVFQKMGLIKK